MVYGVAGAPDDVPAETDTEILDRYTAAVLGQWRAWAVGDTFSWRVTDLTGGEVELCWGYYGFWSSDSADSGSGSPGTGAESTCPVGAVGACSLTYPNARRMVLRLRLLAP